MLGGPAETYIVSHTGRYHFRSCIVWLSASASLVRTSKDLDCKYELQYWTDQAEADMITHTPLDIVAFPNGPAKAIRVRTDSMGAAPRDAKFPLELPLPLFHGKKLPEQVGENPCDNRGQLPDSLRHFLKQSPDALRDTAGENYQEHVGANSQAPPPPPTALVSSIFRSALGSPASGERPNKQNGAKEFLKVWCGDLVWSIVAPPPSRPSPELGLKANPKFNFGMAEAPKL